MGFSRPSLTVAGKNRRFALSAANAPVYRIIRWQLLATIVASVICAIFDGVAAYSILLGGVTCIIPSAFSAWRLLRETADPGAAVGHMIMAETGKLLVTVAIFIAVFLLVEPLDVLLYFGTFIGLQSFYILVPLWQERGQKRGQRSELSRATYGQ
jgi:ATP synthase protein I